MCMLYVIKFRNSLHIKPANNNAPDMSQLSHTLGTARHLDNILAAEWRCDTVSNGMIQVTSTSTWSPSSSNMYLQYN